MTKRKRNVIIAGIVIIGIVGVLFLLPNLFAHRVTQQDDGGAWELTFQERLLEYADFGISFDEEIQGFFYNGQRVRRFVDGSMLFQYDNGVGEITIRRNSEGEIIEVDVR
jgi:hypothetical protein